MRELPFAISLGQLSADAFSFAFGMFWEILWALILGFCPCPDIGSASVGRTVERRSRILERSRGVQAGVRRLAAVAAASSSTGAGGSTASGVPAAPRLPAPRAPQV